LHFLAAILFFAVLLQLNSLVTWPGWRSLWQWLWCSISWRV